MRRMQLLWTLMVVGCGSVQGDPGQDAGTADASADASMEGARRCAADGVTPEVYMDGQWVPTAACSTACRDGECTVACTDEGATECRDATTFGVCEDHNWSTHACSSCANATCNQPLTLCADDKSTSTVLRLELRCGSSAPIQLPFSAGTAAFGCFAINNSECAEASTVTVSLVNVSSSVLPDGIWVGPTDATATLCGNATCTFPMPMTPLFVRGRVCDSDTSGPPGC